MPWEILNFRRRFALVPLLLLAVALLSASGCATNDSENLSSRPWNTPKTWEHGLPSGMYEGR